MSLNLNNYDNFDMWDPKSVVSTVLSKCLWTNLKRMSKPLLAKCVCILCDEDMVLATSTHRSLCIMKAYKQ